MLPVSVQTNIKSNNFSLFAMKTKKKKRARETFKYALQLNINNLTPDPRT